MCQPALQAGNSNVIADRDAMVWVEKEEETRGARPAESCGNDSLLSFATTWACVCESVTWRTCSKGTLSWWVTWVWHLLCQGLLEGPVLLYNYILYNLCLRLGDYKPYNFYRLPQPPWPQLLVLSSLPGVPHHNTYTHCPLCGPIRISFSVVTTVVFKQRLPVYPRLDL